MTILNPRLVPLGGLRAMTVRRTLPHAGKRTIGAWCFVDHFGPDPIVETGGMNVAPHPHTGLQTVTWLFEGEVEHRDSVGSQQLVTAGQVNLMTAGRGISHSEVSTEATTSLHGVQLWVALPDEHRHVLPFFEHHVPPRASIEDAQLTVFVGELLGVTAPTTVFSPLVGAEVILPAGGRATLPVEESFEYGILVDAGAPMIGGQEAVADQLVYREPGAAEIAIEAGGQPCRLVLLGGVPFGERLVMWWNFIGRSHQEIVEFREQWQADVVAGGDPDGIYGTVAGGLAPVPAPEMPNVTLRPRG